MKFVAPSHHYVLVIDKTDFTFIVQYSTWRTRRRSRCRTCRWANIEYVGTQVEWISLTHEWCYLFVGIDDLLNVLEQLSDLTATKYKKLGLKLGLLAPTLNNLQGSENFGWDVMEAWLNQKDNVENPTWKSLIAALESPIVGEKVTAQRVRQWLTSR